MGITKYFASIILLGMFLATSCNWLSGIEAAHSSDNIFKALPYNCRKNSA